MAFGGLAWILFAAVATGAAAEPESARVPLLPPGATVGLAAAQRNELEERIERGLDRAGLEVVRVPGAKARQCKTAKCYQTMALSLDARYLVVPALEVALRDYALSLRLIDGQTGSEVGHNDERCRPCGFAEAAELATKLATQMRHRIDLRQEELAPIHVVSIPPGAAITIDDDAMGVAPLDVELSAGPHVAVAWPDEDRRSELRFSATAGVAETIELRLPPGPQTADALARRRRRVIAGWSLGAVGAALTVTGAVFLGIDSREVRNRCQGDDVDVGGNCRHLFNSLPYGIISISAGVAMLGAGVGLLVSRNGRRPPPAARRRWRALVSIMGAGAITAR